MRSFFFCTFEEEEEEEEGATKEGETTKKEDVSHIYIYRERERWVKAGCVFRLARRAVAG